MADPFKRPLQVGLISLGCAKNLVDSEIMIGSLLQDGVQITNDAAAADVVIVNTCSFIDAAQEESVDTILASAVLRERRNRRQGLVVAGCLPQRFRDELPELLPEVDAFMGIDQVRQVSAIVRQALARRAERLELSDPSRKPAPSQGKARQIARRFAQGERSEARAALDQNSRAAANTPALVEVATRPNYIPDYVTPRFRLTPPHYAYLKIAEGCNHPCSFCMIPRMRGSHRSRPQSDIIQEAKHLIADGVKEINLISQDSTFYGLDLRPSRIGSIAAPAQFQAAASALPADAVSLCTLLRELNAIPGDFWVRLLYTHPAHWTDQLMEAIAACSKVARYVDLPLQHIHDVMLERMRRETSRQYIVDLIRHIRRTIPQIAIRTTFIVGFPGETEDYFQTLLDFILETKFERLGVFTYSAEQGTRAAKMSLQIPEAVKKRRQQLAMAAQRQVAREISKTFVGRELKVLVEKEANANELAKANVRSWEHGLIRGSGRGGRRHFSGRYLAARGEADAPDIDGRIYLRGQLPLGEFARVKIVGHTDYDLTAEPIE